MTPRKTSAPRSSPTPPSAKPTVARTKALPPKSATPGAKAGAPVWAHGGEAASDDLALVVAYCAGRDVAERPMADAALVPWDIWTNRAHCAMLARKKIIGGRDLVAIDAALSCIEAEHAKGVFALDPSLEDVHINVERAVARIAGEAVAGVMHTARSRNDQTATDIRLWMRDRLLAIAGSLAATIDAFSEFAARHARAVMPGWTHGQPAMPTTLGHWAAAHAFGLARDARALIDLWPAMNLCPLGSAAGFGSSWPIDRALTARLLGFDAPTHNSLDSVSTRWELESRLGFALSTTMTHLSSVAQDVYFLYSPPRRRLALDAAFTTGSSIMPQKRNPDFAEVTRARAASVQGMLAALSAVGRGALSGYNRDTQWSKYWIMDLVDEVGVAPEVFARMIATLRPDVAGLEADAALDFVSAVDLADHLASTRAVPFRRVYHVVGRTVGRDLKAGEFRLETLNEELAGEGIHPPMSPAELREIVEPRRAVVHRTSAGGPSPDDVLRQSDELRGLATETRKWAVSRGRELENARKALRREIEAAGRR